MMSPFALAAMLLYLGLVLFAVWAVIQDVVALRSIAVSLRQIADRLDR